MGGDGGRHLPDRILARRRVVGGELVPGAAADDTDDATAPAVPEGWTRVTVPMADPAVLADLILQFGPDAVVLAPGSLRDLVVERLERLSA